MNNPLKHKEQRVLVLFDVQNMYYSAKQLYDQKVSFKEILKEAVGNRKLIRSIAYVIKADMKDENLFHDALNNVGIEVKAKNLQIFTGGGKKGDWDIGIAMDAVRMVSKVDCVVLVSGDGDFKDLLAYLKSHGCRTEVIAFSKTASKQIKEEADEFFDLSVNLKRFLLQDDRRNRYNNQRKYSQKANNNTNSNEKGAMAIKTQNKGVKSQEKNVNATDIVAEIKKETPKLEKNEKNDNKLKGLLKSIQSNLSKKKEEILEKVETKTTATKKSVSTTKKKATKKPNSTKKKVVKKTNE